MFFLQEKLMFGMFLCNKKIAKVVNPWTAITAQSDVVTHIYLPWKHSNALLKSGEKMGFGAVMSCTENLETAFKK